MSRNSEIEIRQQLTKLLIGAEKLERLRRMRVLVLGVGGVGSYAAEQLVRAGVGHLVLIDGDTVESSNCNRQLSALDSSIGCFKAEVLSERFREINPGMEVVPVVEFLRPEEARGVLEGGFDYAVDAIDQLATKVAFILACLEQRVPLISAMGAGGKTDPSQVRIADISHTCGCALARAVRVRLRELGVTKGVETVYSPEVVSPEAIHTWQDEAGHRHSKVGTISYMPAIFGCFCASRVLRSL